MNNSEQQLFATEQHMGKRATATRLAHHLRERSRMMVVNEPNYQVPDKWRDDAACAGEDPEIFFPTTGISADRARRVCIGCSVRKACLFDALQITEDYGVRGGVTERERRKLNQLRAKRHAEQQAANQ